MPVSPSVFTARLLTLRVYTVHSQRTLSGALIVPNLISQAEIAKRAAEEKEKKRQEELVESERRRKARAEREVELVCSRLTFTCAKRWVEICFLATEIICEKVGVVGSTVSSACLACACWIR